jgi:hypothetical protein
MRFVKRLYLFLRDGTCSVSIIAASTITVAAVHLHHALFAILVGGGVK